MGRLRVKGQQLAFPQEIVAHTATRASLIVTWDGGTVRAIEVAPGTGHWYRIGEALVDVRWVDVHDGTGTQRDEYGLTTDRSLKPPQIVAC
jgi:hypothetical protein